MHSSYNLHNSYNLLNSHNLHNSYNLDKSYGKINFLKQIKKPIKHFLYIFLLYLKILTGYYQENKERLQKNLANDIEIFQKKKKNKKYKYARERYRNVSEEGRNKKCQYDRERYINLREDEKQRLVVYIKIILNCKK